jgi:putative membrane protein
MPAFVGLFAVPYVLGNILSRTEIPRQHVCTSVDVTPWLIVRGVGAGALGGLLAAFFPAISGGIGGLIAGQATAQDDDRLFILSQGTSKVVYYVGALLFFFAPGLHLTRGAAWMLRPLYVPHTPEEYWLAVAATALCGALALSLLLWFSRLAIALVSHVNYRWISWGTLVALVALIVGVTGWRGLAITLAATGIGLIPLMFHSRRMNCMGVLLVPMTLKMAGLGPTVAEWLGLL